MARIATLGLLAAVHIAAHFAHHLDGTRFYQAIGQFGAGEVWVVRDVAETIIWTFYPAQAALVACWFSFTARALLERTVVAAILLGLLAVSMFDLFWTHFAGANGVLQIALIGVSLIAPAFFAVVVVLLPGRAFGKWRWRRRDEQRRQGASGQFHLRNMLLWTLGAAVVLGWARWAIPAGAPLRGLPMDGEIYTLLALSGALLGLHAGVIAWACAAPRGKLAAAIAVAAFVVAVLSVVEGIAFSELGLYVNSYEVKLHLLGAAAHFVVFGGTLLIVRACGWRLEREASVAGR